jgi:uncharacterized protein (TIGR00369 family)
MQDDANHVKVTEMLRQAMGPATAKLQVPPTSFTNMQCRFVDLREDHMGLTISFPYDPRFCNPVGAMQGGMLVTAFDNAFGPLSYFIAQRPTVTLHIHTDFMRPFTDPEDTALVTVECTAKTRTLLFMSGELTDQKGRLMATATTQLLILSDEQLKRY